MNAMIRFAGTLLTIAAVLTVGVLVFDAIGLGGAAWFALLLAAILLGALVDRDRFYGSSAGRPT